MPILPLIFGRKGTHGEETPFGDFSWNKSIHVHKHTFIACVQVTSTGHHAKSPPISLFYPSFHIAKDQMKTFLNLGLVDL